MARPKRRSRIHPTAADERLLLGELMKRRRGVAFRSTEPRARRTFAFLSTFFRQQRQFADDPSKLKCALTTRRAGKSTSIAGMLIDAAMNEPDSTCIFIALTRKQAKKIMWKELVRLDRLYSLGLKFNKTDLTATLRNGAEIVVCGATDERDIDRLRGQAFLICAIDEAGSFPESLLEELIDEVLEPATLDYDGTIIMTGTPTAACAGLFFRATTGAFDKNGRPTPRHKFVPGKPAGEGWSVHEWTLHDNPYIPKKKSAEIKTAADWLARMRRRRGMKETDAKYRREYCAEWVRSDSDIVYREFSDRNVVTRLPRLPEGATWTYGISVDLGYDDPTAIAVLAWCEDVGPDIYCARVKRKSGMIPAQVAAEIQAIERRAEAEGAVVAFVVVDQGGGSGKIVTEELRQLYLIDARGAEKNKKPTFIEFANGDFRTGRLKIVGPACDQLVDEIRLLQWDPKKPGKEDPRFANDCADAFLYGYREARKFVGAYEPPRREPDELRPEEGSPEAAERIADALEEEIERKEKAKRDDDWSAP